MDIYAYYCRYYDKKYLYGKTGPELLSARAEVDRIYQSALDTVGFFIDADSLFRDYKQFLDRQPRIPSDVTYTLQSIAAWRSFFHRVISLPIHSTCSLQPHNSIWTLSGRSSASSRHRR